MTNGGSHNSSHSSFGIALSILGCEQSEGLVCLGRVRSVIVSNPIGMRLLSTLPRCRLRLKQEAEILPIVTYLFKRAWRPGDCEQLLRIPARQPYPVGADNLPLGSLLQRQLS